MDGLNSSVITGKCPGCAAYREKVARLEAELAKAQEKERPNVCSNCQHDEHYFANHREPNNPCGTEGCGCTRYLPYREIEERDEG